jgi:MoxR-like ATPase
MGVSPPLPANVFGPSELVALQHKADRVFVHNALVDYTVRLVLATRAPADHGMTDVAQLIQYGASPRASLGIVRATRALALLRGRDYALPQDVQDVAPDILRHRLVLSYDALADDVPADHIIGRVMAAVPLPTVAPRQQATPNGQPIGPPYGVAQHSAPPAAAQPSQPAGAWPGRLP